MNVYKLLPLTYEAYDTEVESIQLYNVVFKEDWGSYKKNQEVKSLYIDYENCRVVEYDDEGKETKATSFKAVPL